MTESVSLLSSVSSINTISSRAQCASEHLNLKAVWFQVSKRYGSARKCVSSKAALLILLWSFMIGLWSGMVLSPDFFLKLAGPEFYALTLVGYGIVAIILCFFPLAGFMADVKYGRYKTIICSLILALMPVAIILVVVGSLTGAFYTWSLDHSFSIAETIFLMFAALCGLVLVVVSFVGVVIFTANVVQFGMDQLHDSPGEDRTLFIHWYVWVNYFSSAIGQFPWWSYIFVPNNYTLASISSQLAFLLMISAVVVIATLLLARKRRRWFLIEPGRRNPYKLVYRVTRYALKHKVPVNRSAFTYCEDDLPTGLDLAKEKYGGSFTTEQVEDVKAFYGILRVLFSLGTVFFLDFAANDTLLYPDPQSLVAYSFLNFDVLPQLGIVVCIPLFLYLLHPFLSRYLPGMLKRMGIGITFVVLSILVSFSTNTAAHVQYNTTVCVFDSENTESFPPIHWSFSVVQLALSSLSKMLIYISAFEFICSQSPHSMKGLLIGLFYTIKGLYQVIASLFVVPFVVGLLNKVQPSCGFYYYLTNVVLGFLAVIMFACVSKKYRYRERDEPSNIHRYAEEYYSILE